MCDLVVAGINKININTYINFYKYIIFYQVLHKQENNRYKIKQMICLEDQVKQYLK